MDTYETDLHITKRGSYLTIVNAYITIFTKYIAHKEFRSISATAILSYLNTYILCLPLED